MARGRSPCTTAPKSIREANFALKSNGSVKQLGRVRCPTIATSCPICPHSVAVIFEWQSFTAEAQTSLIARSEVRFRTPLWKLYARSPANIRHRRFTRDITSRKSVAVPHTMVSVRAWRPGACDGRHTHTAIRNIRNRHKPRSRRHKPRSRRRSHILKRTSD